MNKKIIFSLLVLFLFLTAAGVVFYFCWQGGPELRALNKNLPKGIRVEKRKERQQVVINSKDGYEIKTPQGWQKIKKINFRQTEKTGILSIESVNGKVVEIKVFNGIKTKTKDWLFDKWKKEAGVYVSPTILGEEKNNNYEIIKTKDFGGNIGDIYFYYLRKEGRIYEFSSDSEEAIEEIIKSGDF